MRQKTTDPKRLYPEPPPKRLADEEALAQLRQDPAYRKNASLARALLHRPRRLFEAAPRRLLPASTRRELAYRLVATATSFAVLLASLQVFPLQHRASAVTEGDVTPDYSWLTKYAGTQEDPYQISSAQQLHAVARIVQKLTAEGATMTTDDGLTITAGTAAESVPGNLMLLPLSTPEPTAVPSAEPSATVPPSPEATATPDPTPEVTVTPEPTAAPEPTATAEPTPVPTPEPTAAPTPKPTETPISTPTPEDSAEPTESIYLPVSTGSLASNAAGSAALAALAAPLAATAVEGEVTLPTPAPDPDPTPAPGTTDESTSNPGTGETTAPDENSGTEATTQPTATPGTEETTDPGRDPETGTTAPPTSTPTTEETTNPGEDQDPNTGAATQPPQSNDALSNGDPTPTPSTTPEVKAITVPVGFEGRYFVLTADLDLSPYQSDSTSGTVSGYKPWVPIGTMDGSLSPTGAGNAPFLGTFDGKDHTITNLYYPNTTVNYGPLVAAGSKYGFGLFGLIGETGTVKNLIIQPAAWGDANKPYQMGGAYTDATTSVDTTSHVGVLAGACVGTVENCAVTSPAFHVNTAASSTPNIGGLVGLLGDTGSLTGCTLQNGSLTFTLSSSSAPAVGGLAGTSTGTMTSCKVLNTAFTVAQNSDSIVRFGGLVGIQGGNDKTDTLSAYNLSECIFTGSITGPSSGGSSKSRVGGLVGWASNSGKSVNIANCAVGADISVHNDNTVSTGGGIGGLVGYQGAQLTLDGCFAAGRVRGNHQTGGLLANSAAAAAISNSFSAMAVERFTNADTALNRQEAIGGLFGLFQDTVTVTDCYLAGSLLSPQFGSLVGYCGSATGAVRLPNVYVDAVLAPNGPCKYKGTSGDDIKWTGSEVTKTQFPTATDVSPSSWTNADGYYPQLAWAAQSTDEDVRALSLAAAKRWVALDDTNSYTGADGQRTIYRLKDGATFTGLTLTDTDGFTGSGGTSDKVGGLFKTQFPVGGYDVPVIRKAFYALTQADSKANVITDGASLVRFTDQVNRYGGGYLGGVWKFAETVNAAGTAVPSYAGLSGYAAATSFFCGTLEGSGETVGSSTVMGVSYTENDPVGLLATAYFATIRNFTLSNVTVTGLLQTNNTSFGAVGSKLIGGTVSNVSVQNLTYLPTAFTKSLGGGGGGEDRIHIGGLFGIAKTHDASFLNCSVTGLQVAVSTSSNQLAISVGGILAHVSTGNTYTFTHCDTDMDVTFSFTSNNANPTQNTAPSIGGIVAYNNSGATNLSNCHTTGQMTGGNVGGMLGRTLRFNLTNCTFAGTLSTSSGIQDDSTKDNTGGNTGGLIGYPQHTSCEGSITGCAVLGSISAQFSAGGLIGYLTSNKSIVISDCSVSGVVSSNSSTGAAGGMVGAASAGAADNLTIRRAYFAGQVESSKYKGGIVGNLGNDTKTTFADAYFDASLTQTGLSAIGTYADMLPEAAVPRDSGVWNTTLGSADAWTAGDAYHYPGIKDLKDLAPAFTQRLFRLTSSGTVYAVSLNDLDLKTVLPGAVTAQPGDGCPFVPVDEPPVTEGSYTVTSYTAASGSAELTGPLVFTYTGLGKDFSIPYTVGLNPFEEGDGSAQNPFIIPDAKTLDTFRRYVDLGRDSQNTHYLIGALETHTPVTIALETATDTWTPGPWPGVKTAFAGKLNGNGSTITGLSCTGWQDEFTRWNSGLFYSLTSTAAIRDLTISGARISMPGGHNAAAGVLAARSDGAALQNLQITGTIDASYRSSLGGLVGLLSPQSDTAFSGITADVAITGSDQALDTSLLDQYESTGDRTNPRTPNTGGGGGIVGKVLGDETKTITPSVTFTQCAAYGSVNGMTATGGLIGLLDNRKLNVTLTDNYSLTQFIDNAAMKQAATGGMVGAVYHNLSLGLSSSNYNGNLTLTRCYYAGESDYTFAAASGAADAPTYRLSGGLVGRVPAKTTLDGGEPKRDSSNHIVLSGTNVKIEDSYFNSDANYYPVWVPVFNANSKWYNERNDNLDYLLASRTFVMSRTESDSVMSNWNTAAGQTVWSFAEGLFPVFAGQTLDDALTMRHIAVHTTPSGGGGNHYANVYVRYAGATVSAPNATTAEDSAPLRRTYNEKMLVATQTGEGQVTVTVTWKDQTRTLNIVPDVTPANRSDVSSFYVNPDGMWEEGVRQWTLYTANALAGLSVQVDQGTDENLLPHSSTPLVTGDTITLGRDIDLSAAPDIPTIGTDAHPFVSTFDGAGRFLENFTQKDFYAAIGTGGVRYTGLFGVADSGARVQNLTLTAGAKTDSGVHVFPSQHSSAALCAVVKSGVTLKNCFVSTPIFGVPNTRTTTSSGGAGTGTGTGTGSGPTDASVGGLVGRVDGAENTMTNCAFTGYIYAALPDGTSGAAGAPAGGLVGLVTKTGALTMTGCYAAGYMEGGNDITGGVDGLIEEGGDLTAVDCAYDGNAAGLAVPAVGSGAIASNTPVPAQVPATFENSYTDAVDGLYPFPSALVRADRAAEQAAMRMRLSVDAHAKSASSGSISYIGGSIVYSENRQPDLDGNEEDGTINVQPVGSVTVAPDGQSFTKGENGFVQLELHTGGAAGRRALVNVRCWYDDWTVKDGIKHYTITAPAELAELAALVNGTVNQYGSLVGHTHGGGSTDFYDDFSGAVVHIAADLDLSLLTDSTGKPRPWTSIGDARPFAGTLDGGGHAVTGLTATGDALGLFDTVGETGVVQDLLVSGADLTVNDNGSAGLLALRSQGIIQHCGVSGAVNAGAGTQVGGLCAVNDGTVIGCFSTAELVQNTGRVGGLAASGSGSITQSWFAGYCRTGGTAAGIAANETDAAVTNCYVAAFLQGATVYSAAPGATNCQIDQQLTSQYDGTATPGATLALSMSGEGWTAAGGGFYPRLAHYTALKEGDSLYDSALARSADLAAAQFAFTGMTEPGYARFKTVQVSTAGGDTGRFLQTGDTSLLSVGGQTASLVRDATGEVVLRLCLGTTDAVLARNPCYLVIPASLAVTYTFDWDALLTSPGVVQATPPEAADVFNSSDESPRIRTANDWNAFVSYINANPSTTKTFRLERDIDFGGASLSPIPSFSGVLDGGSHTLSSFSLTGPLFGTVTDQGRVERLGLTNVSVTVTASGPLQAAVVAGTNSGRIADVAVEGSSVTATQTANAKTSVAGLVARNLGTLDGSYFYTTEKEQIKATIPTTTVDLEMGGIAGYNAGLIRGCYSAATLSCGYSYTQIPLSAMVGRNDGGRIVYSYWVSHDPNDQVLEGFPAYRNSDGTTVPGTDLYFGGKALDVVAQWLSADLYGGAYYVDGGHLKLYHFKLAQYDFTGLFGADQPQYMMLAFQYVTDANQRLFSNGICSWQDYLFPNFADLPLTSALSVQMPLLSDALTYHVGAAYVIRADTPRLSSLSGNRATVQGSAGQGFHITSLGTNPVRVLVTVGLVPKSEAEQERPWGVYRSHMAGPPIAETTTS